MKQVLQAALLLILASWLGGCSSSQQNSCTGPEDCPAGQVCGPDGKCHDQVEGDACDSDGCDWDGGDSGTADGDSGPPPCTHDRECPPDKVCEISTGQCVDGQACQASYNCPSGQYCEPTGGVCKTRSELCEPCTTDEQCPDPGMGDLCIEYADGKFCGQHCDPAQCPPGYVCDQSAGSGSPASHGQCRSNTGECGSTFVCHEDGDCAANKVCNQATGKCVAKCQDIGCPAGQVCHATGHCGAACTGNDDCASLGDGLVCCTGAGQPVSFCTADTVGVCRPAGCVSHAECLLTGGESLGYCDKRDGQCREGCRYGGEIGVVSDCKSGYECQCTQGTVTCDSFDCCPDPGAPESCVCDPESEDCSQVSVCDNGQCVKIPCYERGVAVACAAHNLCCGFPVGDYYSCPTDVSEGDCYLADKDAWCAACGEEGKSCQTPNLGHGEPGVCLSDDKDGNTYCHPACRDTNDCPATWSCNYAYAQGCQDASNCEATASCELVYKGYDDQGQVQEVNGCHCTSDNDCPADINGFRAVCVDTTICDYTVDPPDCHQGKVCKFAKACLSPIGCGTLHGN